MALPPEDPRVRRRQEASRRRRRRRWTGLASAAGVLVTAGVAVALLRGGGEGSPAPAAASPPASAATTAATGPAPAAPPERLTLPATAAPGQVTVPVLMYHRVAPAATATNEVSRDLTVTPEAFRAQMAWLARNGYTPVSQARLFAAIFRGARLPRKPVSLTFDDGYVDAVTAVLPVLERRGWTASFFIITGRIGTPAFLTWPELLRLQSAGMEVASHTVDHVELPSLSAAERARQLTRSRSTLEKGLGRPVYWFVYPAGRHDSASERAVRKAGYLLAYTTEDGSTLRADARVALPRVRVRGEGTLDEFAAALRSASLP